MRKSASSAKYASVIASRIPAARSRSASAVRRAASASSLRASSRAAASRKLIRLHLQLGCLVLKRLVRLSERRSLLRQRRVRVLHPMQGPLTFLLLLPKPLMCGREPDRLRDVLHLVDQVRDRARHRSADRRVERAPVPLFPRTVQARDGVGLHRHPIRDAGGHRALQGGAQVAHAGGLGVARRIGKGLEEAEADDAPGPLARGQRGTQVRVADGHDREPGCVGAQNEVQSGCGLEEAAKVGDLSR